MKSATGLLRHIRACNAFNTAGAVPFMVAGRPVGWLRRDRLDMLTGLDDVFLVEERSVALREPDAAPGASIVAARSAVLHDIVGRMVASGALRKRRQEIYPIFQTFGEAPLAGIDRIAVSAFGIPAVGVHMNGYVRKPDGLYLWIARRAKDKMVAPGKLDNLVAGGQPIGLGLRENLIKECGEEAAIAPDLARQAVAVGAVRYRMDIADGVRNDILFLYDLELPADFVPDNADGEHEAFYLLPVADVIDLLRRGDDFKFNVPLVIIDFLIRHGVIDGENEPDYLDLISGLHR